MTGKGRFRPAKPSREARKITVRLRPPTPATFLHAKENARADQRPHATYTQEGYEAGTCRQASCSRDGLSLPASSARVARHARSGVSRAKEGHPCARLLLASASVRSRKQAALGEPP